MCGVHCMKKKIKMLRMNRQIQSIVKTSIVSVFNNDEIVEKIADKVSLKVIEKINEKLDEQRTKCEELRNVELLEAYFRANSRENGIYTALLIEELQGLDYGSGMAHSFYHGYLRLILPQESKEKKCVKTNIEVYQSSHNVTFATKKIYILIPLSAHCPNKLTDVSKKIEDGHVTKVIEMDVAGVRDRVYKNTVYKLLPDNNKVVYVMAEYATPLRTLSKVIAHNSDESRRYKRFKKEIVTNFFMSLDKLIREDPECRDYCHLIYFKDIDENGEPLQIDICDLILSRINSDLNK